MSVEVKTWAFILSLYSHFTSSFAATLFTAFGVFALKSILAG
tara:strand:+ start:329 stop:454 length:126 start_codon:yes stop_codon:yes gene_type:complete